MCFKNANDFYIKFYEQLSKYNDEIKLVFNKSEMEKLNNLLSAALKSKFTSEEAKATTLDIINLLKNKFTPYIII